MKAVNKTDWTSLENIFDIISEANIKETDIMPITEEDIKRLLPEQNKQELEGVLTCIINGITPVTIETIDLLKRVLK